jgi:hypothetical protein
VNGEIAGSLAPAIAAGVTMLSLTVRLKVLRLPERTWRCGACRRIVRRGSICRCARPD